MTELTKEIYYNMKNDKFCDWHIISSEYILNEDIIREFQDKVNWFYISHYQTLSEEIIIDFQDYVHWNMISRYQKLSEEFVIKFLYKIHINRLVSNRVSNLSEEFIDKISVMKKLIIGD